MPLMSEELHYSNMQLANVVFGYSLLYASGQFVFGVLADRFGSRLIVTAGLLVAVVSNLLLGLAPSLAMMVLFACLNGAGQSAGWPAPVKNMAAWFRPRERGIVMAWWTTNYVIGGFVGTVFATFVVTSPWLMPRWGWHRAFWIPAAALFVITVFYVMLVRNRPSEAGLSEIVDGDGELAAHNSSTGGSFRAAAAIYLRMLKDWDIWTVAVGALFVKVTRYSFMFWLPLYLTQRLKVQYGRGGLHVVAI